MSDYCTRPNRRRRLGVALIRAMVGLWRGFWNRAANARQKLTTQLLGSQSLSVSKHQSFHCAGLTDPQVHGHLCAQQPMLCALQAHTLCNLFPPSSSSSSYSSSFSSSRTTQLSLSFRWKTCENAGLRNGIRFEICCKGDQRATRRLKLLHGTIVAVAETCVDEHGLVIF